MSGNGPDIRDDGTVIEHSRVLTWQRSVAESARDDMSVASFRTSASNAKSLAPSKAPSVVSTVSKAASMARSVSAPVQTGQVTVEHTSTTKISATGDGAAKKIIGTLIGAAAGAAVAYMAVRSEGDSAKKEAEFEAFMRAKSLAAQTNPQPKLSLQDPQQFPEASTPPKSVLHRNIDDGASNYSSSSRERSGIVNVQRQIEAAPSSYYHAHPLAAPTHIDDRRALEYAPAYSVAPSRTHFTAPQRALTSPAELITLSEVSRAHPKSHVSKARSIAPSAAPSAVHSTAPSTLISSFVPDQPTRRSSEGSIHSHHSSKSRSSKSHVSKHSSGSRHTSKSHSRAPSPPPTQSRALALLAPVQEKAGSIVGSILGRDNGSSISKKSDPFQDKWEIEEFDDTDTVAPSDSISQVGSSVAHRSHRSHKSHKSSKSKHDGSGSEVSRHSSSSKHSKGSRSHHSSSSKKSHSSRRRSHSRERHSSPLSQEWHSAAEQHSVVLPTIISEPSDVSTVKPIKGKKSRKDSVAHGQYDDLFNGVSYGAGTVASLPIRAPSFLDEGKKGNRSVMSYSMGQKLRPFEER